MPPFTPYTFTLPKAIAFDLVETRENCMEETGNLIYTRIRELYRGRSIKLPVLTEEEHDELLSEMEFYATIDVPEYRDLIRGGREAAKQMRRSVP